MNDLNNHVTLQNVTKTLRAPLYRSWSVTALVYKPRILGLKNEE